MWDDQCSGTVARYSQGLDPQLYAPARLFIVAVLVDMRWCGFGSVRDALGLTDVELSQQLTKLHMAGYVQTQCAHGRCTEIRLTLDGCDRLVRHLEALQAVVFKVAELIAVGNEDV
ncbi:transcriptional regulator [Amycolatopsis plumensis]|uniref:Transcriptional regulator n=1 Tax=Amycolatopsis plumensis TaxID=236508 RepID=A0ABV5UAL1_9PSEU